MNLQGLKVAYATKATTFSGQDIGRMQSYDNLPLHTCIITGEDGEDYLGHWLEGIGFFDVHFPKETTKLLREEDIKELEKGTLVITSVFNS